MANISCSNIQYRHSSNKGSYWSDWSTTHAGGYADPQTSTHRIGIKFTVPTFSGTADSLSVTIPFIRDTDGTYERATSGTFYVKVFSDDSNLGSYAPTSSDCHGSVAWSSNDHNPKTVTCTVNLSGSGVSITSGGTYYLSITSSDRIQCGTAKESGGTSFSVSLNYTVPVTTYTLSLSKGTGISSVSGAGTYNSGTYATVNAAVSTGYTWSGWTGTVNQSQQSFGVLMDRNHSITANATANSYTITLNANGGNFSDNSTSKTVGVTFNSTANCSLDDAYLPTRPGYTFKGYCDGNGMRVYWSDGACEDRPEYTYWSESNTWQYAGDVELYAQWEANGDTITCDYRYDDFIFDEGQYLDTGHIIDWDNDFNLELGFKIPNLDSSRRYLIIGNYDDADTKVFNLEVKNGHLRLYLGANVLDADNIVSIDSDVCYYLLISYIDGAFKYHLNKYEDGEQICIAEDIFELNISGKSEYSLNIGTRDHRSNPDQSNFGKIEISPLEVYLHGIDRKALYELPRPRIYGFGNYQFAGFYDEQDASSYKYDNIIDLTVEGGTFYAVFGYVRNLYYTYITSSEPNIFSKGEYLDTGVLLDWDRDFEIAINVNNNFKTGSNYLFIGNKSDTIDDKYLNIELLSGKVHLYFGKGENESVTFDYVPSVRETVYINFTWYSSSKTYYLHQDAEEVVGTLNRSGKSKLPLRIGTVDNSSTCNYEDIEFTWFSIEPDLFSCDGTLILPKPDKKAYKFIGWDDDNGNVCTELNLLDDSRFEHSTLTLYPIWEPLASMYVKTTDGWKNGEPFVKIGDQWKKAVGVFAKVGNTWKWSKP